MRLEWDRLAGLRVTVMGLGLHGGGAASAAFFARHGAEVTVTDLRSESELAASLERLASLPLRYVLGRHEMSDFETADIVVKNPAVAADSPYLQAARRIESDISVFLALAANPIVAVTGTKGKSTTASAIHHVLRQSMPSARLGGNITVSPLTFLDELRGDRSDTPVVLELSSWQLADLRGKRLLRPHVALITNILPDHMNRYSGMDQYVADKTVIVDDQSPADFTVCNYDDPYVDRFVRRSRARLCYFSSSGLPSGLEGAWLDGADRAGRLRAGGRTVKILGDPLIVPGSHNRLNLLAAGVALSCSGLEPQRIAEGLRSFPGIPHRLEFVAEIDGRRYYNDSAATIPEATEAATASFADPVVLIAGGTDKALDFRPFHHLSRNLKSVVLLSGSATSKAASALSEEGVPWSGPYDSIGGALSAAGEQSVPGDVILFSPGCASFEMFKNEFDRGESFIRAVKRIDFDARVEERGERP